ncbi:unnamed protein product [Phytophthora lilii]|uniref:Unnamed protein product n=1 Tax=Phytophthora lilii TaxID=2077276 RepID=A0A9W6TS02_9STRA|nr:unnamed protein product [Phytophthora lilii]
MASACAQKFFDARFLGVVPAASAGFSFSSSSSSSSLASTAQDTVSTTPRLTSQPTRRALHDGLDLVQRVQQPHGQHAALQTQCHGSVTSPLLQPLKGSNTTHRAACDSVRERLHRGESRCDTLTRASRSRMQNTGTSQFRVSTTCVAST